jgi:hypothetical protein
MEKLTSRAHMQKGEHSRKLRNNTSEGGHELG